MDKKLARKLKGFGFFALAFFWNVFGICCLYISATYLFLVVKLAISGRSVEHITRLEIVVPLALLGGLILTLIQRSNRSQK